MRLLSIILILQNITLVFSNEPSITMNLTLKCSRNVTWCYAIDCDVEFLKIWADGSVRNGELIMEDRHCLTQGTYAEKKLIQTDEPVYEEEIVKFSTSIYHNCTSGDRVHFKTERVFKSLRIVPNVTKKLVDKVDLLDAGVLVDEKDHIFSYRWNNKKFFGA